MGRPDQLAKRILQEETPGVTGHRATFEVPSEVPVGALQPDGVVRVVISPGLSELLAPWSRLRAEVTLDVKMPGDHTDRAALGRCELRRYARWVRLLEALPAPEHGGASTTLARRTPDPRDYGTWLVAPHLAGWLRDDAARGVCELEEVAPGCWKVGPGIHETLWIAANDLPLRRELLPFLVARSGRAQAEFLRWAARVMGPRWTLDVVQEIRMSAETADESIYVPEDEEEQRVLKTRYTRNLLRAYPEAANEILEKAREEWIEKGAVQTLTRQFEHRLSRELTPAERAVLSQRIHTHGTVRVGDVVLDLAPAALEAWLRDPDAA